MKARYLTLPIALLIGLSACNSTPTPAPTAPTAEETDAALTPLQKHIKEDAIKEVEKHAFSKQSVIDYLAKEYPVEDVKAGVAAMACEANWMGEAEQYATEHQTKDKSVLLDAGFTDEEAEYGINPVPQN